MGVDFPPSPSGVFDLDTVGVVSVEPGIVERRFDLGVMYEYEGEGAAGTEWRTGTGIRLRRFGAWSLMRCVGGALVSVSKLFDVSNSFVDEGELAGEDVAVEVTEEVKDSPVVDAASREYMEDEAEEVDAELLIRCWATDFVPRNALNAAERD